MNKSIEAKAVLLAGFIGLASLSTQAQPSASTQPQASFLRLVTALLSETSEEWESGKIYLNMENQNPPSV